MIIKGLIFCRWLKTHNLPCIIIYSNCASSWIIVVSLLSPYSLRAQCHYVVGNFSRAAHDCTRSMIISPHYFGDVQWLRALCYYNMGVYYASWVDLR